jgi:hypothetical protein
MTPQLIALSEDVIVNPAHIIMSQWLNGRLEIFSMHPSMRVDMPDPDRKLWTRLRGHAWPKEE